MINVHSLYALINNDVPVFHNNGTWVAFTDMPPDSQLGRRLAMHVFTGADGLLQRNIMGRFPEADLSIVPVSAEELLAAYQIGKPSSVFLDGRKVAGSVFAGVLKDALSIPIPLRIPRRLDIDWSAAS